ncbi:LAFE_0H13366g1_1 [Lachancea fermentati]|uniref:Structural maintenance of chromosomes protein n=1 Tax=Lachancea fermentati TaxID=4955 RepID=A0A1G4MKL9_LACFM|nr:LAFE_0H13366g1_1 [Lachancea fermentati]
MYLKSVTIQGFKTYKNTTIVENFSPRFNVVVGSNGSGKSNFFAAIRFVLSDDYNNLKREERQGLIHQGTGSIMSAYVEIVFHDPEGRMLLSSGIPSNDSKIVKIRRTIGLKKDEYSLNGKTCHKSDVARTLESVGFSSSNPYNIVPQGRIVAVTNAKDRERLALLEEVVGAKTFEIKLRESLKKMEATNKDRMKINKELEELEERLNELDEERRDLEKYRELERDRKSFQFILYDRELDEVTNEIEKLDGEYNSTLHSSGEYIEELEKRETLIMNVTKNIKSIEAELNIKELTDLEQEKARYTEAAKKRAELNVHHEEVQRQLHRVAEQSHTDKENFTILKEEIDKKQKQLQRIIPRFEELTEEKSKYKLDLSGFQRRQREILSKRGIYANFKNQEERDNWLNNEISSVTKEMEDLKSSHLKYTDEITQLEDQISNLEKETEELYDSIEGPGVRAELEDLQNEIDTLKQSYFERIDERKELWRSEQKLQTISETFLDDVKRSERQLGELMDRNLANGLKAVKEIAERLKLPKDSVCGTLGELIKVNEKYKACAEVVGGNSLFNIVVDNDETASILMEELYKSKAGRVTFIPLNRIHDDKRIQYPPNAQSECTPLLWKIKYDKKFEVAVKHVFGKTIVVRDLGSGSLLARKYNLDAVTLDGDRADKRGVITGGYHDHLKRSRLDCLNDINVARSQYSTTSEELSILRKQLEQVDFDVDEINNKIKQSTMKKEAILTSSETLRIKLNKRKTESAIKNETLMSLNSKSQKLVSSLKDNEEKLNRLKNDLTKPFDNELSVDEKEELNFLTKSINKHQEMLSATTESLSGLVTRIDSLKAELELKLQPQMHELETRISEKLSIENQELKEDHNRTSIELEKEDSRCKEIKTSLNAIMSQIDALKVEKANNEKILDKANDQQRLLLKKLENYRKDAEKSIVKKMTLSARRDELQQKVSEIGLLAEDSLVKYKDLPSENIVQRLNSVSEGISKMKNINKRAIDNFKRFNEKKEDLVQRANELTASKESIENLIESLKKQKVQGVETTFRQVAENFNTVFGKLVPNGLGKLIIHRQDESSAKNAKKKKSKKVAAATYVADDSIDSIYSGVSIAVSFNSKDNEQLYVEQLSGGQKTVCAIALILAIQMVDPAPFYLFDEIDAALDKQYRTAVANVIRELSAEAQFICTTFRTDMLRAADQFYRVKYENKISTISEVSQQDAINFIKGNSKMGEV